MTSLTQLGWFSTEQYNHSAVTNNTDEKVQICVYGQKDGWHIKATECKDIEPHMTHMFSLPKKYGNDFMQAWDSKNKQYHQLPYNKFYSWTGSNFDDIIAKQEKIKALEANLKDLKMIAESRRALVMIL